VCPAAAAFGRGGGVLLTPRLPDAYFDTMHAASSDPWQLDTRWYEQRKYAITLSVPPRRRYRRAFEPGCSVARGSTA
jgi:hypothetical protein